MYSTHFHMCMYSGGLHKDEDERVLRPLHLALARNQTATTPPCGYILDYIILIIIIIIINVYIYIYIYIYTHIYTHVIHGPMMRRQCTDWRSAELGLLLLLLLLLLLQRDRATGRSLPGDEQMESGPV